MPRSALEVQMQSLIVELEQTMLKEQLWSTDVPDKKALASTLPFACDTLRFEQWLQFIFIPKIEVRLISQQVLPHQISLYPMAEESWKHSLLAYQQTCRVLKRIDNLFVATP